MRNWPTVFGNEMRPVRSRDPFDALVQNFFSDWNQLPAMFDAPAFQSSFLPSVDLSETEKEYLLEADVPNFDPEKISIEFKDNNTLVLSGTQELDKKDKNNEEKKYYHRERTCTSFYREIRLPGDVNHEHVNATFKNGVLRVTLPKVAQKNNRKKIKIAMK